MLRVGDQRQHELATSPITTSATMKARIRPGAIASYLRSAAPDTVPVVMATPCASPRAVRSRPGVSGPLTHH